MEAPLPLLRRLIRVTQASRVFSMAKSPPQNARWVFFPPVLFWRVGWSLTSLEPLGGVKSFEGLGMLHEVGRLLEIQESHAADYILPDAYPLRRAGQLSTPSSKTTTKPHTHRTNTTRSKKDSQTPPSALRPKKALVSQRRH